MRHGRLGTVVATVAVLLATGCSGPHGPGPEPTREVESTAQPWEQRPVVDLAFDVADDLRTVEGSETVRFTPDDRVCELVFRAWPNKPATARAGSGLVLTAATVDGADVEAVDQRAGAPESAAAGTLLRVPVPGCAEAGVTVVAVLEFRLQLGVDVDERIGRSSAGDAAWFAGAFPLLAWERGRGWDETPAVDVAGEMAASEDFRLASLRVSAPASLHVQGTGRPAGREVDGDRATSAFTASAVRDVAVHVGDHETREFTASGTRFHLAAPRDRRGAPLAEWEDVLTASTADLVDLLGPVPYEDLWVTVVASDSSGIEFPGAAQFADVDPERRRSLLSHELAHQWFYGLVGNDQGRDPWLDESLATFAQVVADGQDASLEDLPPETLGEVGRPVAWFTRYRSPSQAYYDRVYTAGGAALVQARDRVGAEPFDAALRAYVRENAHTIATPQDVAEAFAGLPEVVDVLEEVGALQAGDGTPP